jgi:hypothetical protein
MLGTASSPTTRTVSTRLIFLGTALLVVLGVLALSPAARADSALEAPEGLTSEQAPEDSSGGEAVGGGSQPTGGTEGSTLEAPGPETVGPAPFEPTPEPVSESTPEPTPAPELPPVELPPEPTPVAGTSEAVSEPAPESTAHDSSEEKEKPKEKTAEGAVAMSGPSAPTGTDTGLIAAESESTPPSGPPPPTGSETVKLGEGQEASGGTSGEALARSPAAAERQAVARRCELSALGGPEAGGCAGGWLGLGAAATLAQVPAALAPVAAAFAPAAVGSSGDDSPGGVAGGGRPASPSPGPAPGGAAGGIAAGGSGGVGLAGFLTLAGLLLLAAPRALRRLRLSCRPWLTAFFVLIPERPG